MHHPKARFMALQDARQRWLRFLVLCPLILALIGCSRPTVLERIQQEKVLHVITRDAPSIYHNDQDGPGGFEYELAKRFAEHLGVSLRIQVADNLNELFSVLDQNYTHLAAAGLSITDARKLRYPMSPSYMDARPLTIYNRDVPRPQGPEDLIGKRILVLAGSSHEQRLLKLAEIHPGITWSARSDIDSVGLLAEVESGAFDVAIIDSNELALNHVYFPNVLKGFPLAGKVNFAWFFPPGTDESLQQEARNFFRTIRRNGTLAQIRERHYGHLDRLNYVGARTFVHHLRNRLPTYRDMFVEAASIYGFDWRMLAAIGYQESHWRPNAVSPTGVRGLMMLTQNTARFVGVDNRRDPRESIMGGAKYFKRMLSLIPDDIPEPDRTWFALASYNVGFGHLEDARVLTERDGRNPNRWLDVKEYLPLLAHKEWYTQTTHGYARGYEPVVYVQNIRRYYDVLVWMQPADPEKVGPGSAEEPIMAAESPEYDLPPAQLPAEEADLAELDSPPFILATPPAL